MNDFILLKNKSGCYEECLQLMFAEASNELPKRVHDRYEAGLILFPHAYKTI